MALDPHGLHRPEGHPLRTLAQALTDRGFRQDGQTPLEWLAMMFEFEYCGHCGRDLEDHDVRVDLLGLLHVHCLRPSETSHG